MKFRLIESFVSHETLNQKLFNENDVLKEDVRQALLEISDNFINHIKECEIPIKVVDIWLVGSNAAYSYNEGSDVDIHLIAQLDGQSCDEDLLKVAYDLVKTNYNLRHDITVKGFPVELYVEGTDTTSVSNGVYSIQNNEWVKVPSKEEPYDIDITTSDLYKEYLQRSKSVETIEDIEKFIDDLYLLRKKSLATDGELGEGNLIFKQLRNDGVLDNLKDKRIKLIDKDLTLEGIQK